MNLVRWDPFRELEDFSTRFNRFFGTKEWPRWPNKYEGSKEMMTFADWAPAVDIKETPEEYLIKAELPEVNKEDVKVTIKDGILALAGERKLEKEEKGKKYHRVERAYGSFMRSFVLPDDVDDKKFMANFKDGVLYVHLPKAPATTPKTIDVKVS
jgi:HSP20 family protein